VVLRIVLRPAAEADLDRIWSYTTSAWSEAQAEEYLMGVDSVLRLLAEFPELARLREEFRPAVRIHPHRAHLIIYRTENATLEVLRIIHARTNWTAVLRE